MPQLVRRRPQPRSFDPSPKDYKTLSEIADLVNERYQQLHDPEIVSDPLAPVLLGGTLRLMQDELVRGAYSWWLREYVKFTPRTARRYLQRFYRHMAGKGEEGAARGKS